MTSAADFRSGKTHRDENFPVASRLIRAEHRAPILSFYEFVRVADDISDHSSMSPADKLARLDRLEDSLLGRGEGEPEGVALRAILAERGLSPKHAQDLLQAFRMDVTKNRYRDWDDLIGYCTYSAMPVGRFVLDVHGESRTTWPASDAICAALQIINHLQDCAKDYRDLNRVYIPLDAMAAAGTAVEALGAPKASAALRNCIVALAEPTDRLLRKGAALPDLVKDLRLSLEIAAIQALAYRNVRVLKQRDPLSEKVHPSKPMFAAIGLAAALSGLFRRMTRRPAAARPEHQDA